MKSERELNERIRNSAISCGLCSQWQREWRNDWNLDKLVERFYKGLDFFLKTRFVSNDFIKEGFDKGFLRRKGIIVDDAYSLLNPQMAIMLGASKSMVRVNGYTVSTIYVTDSSDVKVSAKGHSMCLVHVLGQASVSAMNEDKASITVINHSTASSISAADGVKILDEMDYLT